MRLLLKLKAVNTLEFPYDYHYPLSAAIYKILRLGSPEFSEYLHDTGYKLDGKTYKLFSFALRFEKVKPGTDRLSLQSPLIGLYIASPLIDTFINNFVLGTFKNNRIEIIAGNRQVIMNIESVETLPEPVFKDGMTFRLLSPMVLSTKCIINDKPVQHYFRYNDDMAELNRVFKQNLMNKYSLIFNKEAEPDHIEFSWDEDYIRRKSQSNKGLTSLIKFYVSGRIISVVGNKIPFTVTGNPDLIRTGYLCGFGEKNSMGCGFAEEVNK